MTERTIRGVMEQPLRWHVRNRLTGLLVPDDKRKGPRTFSWSFDATAWVTQQLRPQDFEVVQADE